MAATIFDTIEPDSEESFMEYNCYDDNYFHDLDDWKCLYCGYIVPEEERIPVEKECGS